MDCRSTHHSFLGIQALHVPVLFDIRARYPRLYYCTSFLRFRCWCDVLHVVYKRHKAGKPETGATSLFAKRRNSRRPLMGAWCHVSPTHLSICSSSSTRLGAGDPLFRKKGQQSLHSHREGTLHTSGAKLGGVPPQELKGITPTHRLLRGFLERNWHRKPAEVS